MSEILSLGDGPENAMSVNSERGPTTIWREGDLVSMTMRMPHADDGIALDDIESRLQDLSAKAQHEYQMREVFSQAQGRE